MVEDIAQQLFVTVVVAVVLLGLLLAVVLRIATRLARIERRLAMVQDEQHAAMHPGESLPERKALTREQKDMFREYLAEDPERRKMPKKEQFEGYRRWRQERGLNWRG